MQRKTAETLTILYLIESSGGGGAETVVASLASARPQYAHVAALRSGWMQEQLEPLGISCIKIPYRQGNDLALAFRIAALARRVHADIVHCHCFTMNTVGALGAFIARIPSIATVHGVTYDLDTKKRLLAYRIAAKLHRRVVCVSHFLADKMAALAQIPEYKINVIYNGISPTVCEPSVRSRMRGDFGFADSDFVIGSVGMLRLEKGHADLLLALKGALNQCSRFKLVLVGDGPCRAKLEAMASDLGIGHSVRFAGFRSDVPALMRAMDTFVLPSHEEGLSIATIEAMESRLPVLVTDCGGPTEIVSDGTTGLVVPARDSNSMMAALLRLAQDAALRECLADSGHNRAVSMFSIDKMLADYSKLYGRIALKGAER